MPDDFLDRPGDQPLFWKKKIIQICGRCFPNITFRAVSKTLGSKTLSATSMSATSTVILLTPLANTLSSQRFIYKG